MKTKEEILTEIYNNSIGKTDLSLQKFSIEVAMDAMEEFANQCIDEKCDDYDRAFVIHRDKIRSLEETIKWLQSDLKNQQESIERITEKLTSKIKYQVGLLKRLYNNTENLKTKDLQLDGEIAQNLKKHGYE